MAEGQNASGSDKTETAQKHQGIIPPTPDVSGAKIVAANSPQPKTDQQPKQSEQALAEWLREAGKPEWVIVYVTALYTFFSWLQWRAIHRQGNSLDRQIKEAKDSSAASAKMASETLTAIRDQLKSSEAAQAAQLTIEDFICTIVPGDTFLVNAQFLIRNVGSSVAHDIAVFHGGGSVNLLQCEAIPADINLPPNPSPNGPSIAPEKDMPIKFTAGNGPSAHVMAGHTLFFVNASVHYSDIFSNPHITTFNLMYDFRGKRFVLAPHTRQHE